ncbi:hypothetical protein K438DRAFT_1730373 [Mycena galopus ATCC 62051]|nr:hypothetical protein K438DRAFT_1730373 [Mycena galopus ATCC 62051]
MPPKKSAPKKQSTAKRARSPDASSGEIGEVSAKSRPLKRAKEAAALANDNTEGAASEATPSDSESTAPPTPVLSGKFDIYAMELPFLAKVYLPAGKSDPQFAALHETILKYQAKPDSTARCLIPDASSGKPGRLESAIFEDPMEGAPWDIAIEDLELVDALTFSSTERSGFLTPPEAGPGVTGSTVLAEDHCGVQSASGVFRMKHAWTGRGTGAKAQDVDIFEGFLSFNVAHSGLYRRKGHGSGDKIKFAFWAVRARRDAAGLEIGLDEN